MGAKIASGFAAQEASWGKSRTSESEGTKTKNPSLRRFAIANNAVITKYTSKRYGTDAETRAIKSADHAVHLQALELTVD